MIRRLIEADYAATAVPTPEQVRFWFEEGRTPALLMELARRFPEECTTQSTQRLLLKAAMAGREEEIEAALAGEESVERATDRTYWKTRRQLTAVAPWSTP